MRTRYVIAACLSSVVVGAGIGHVLMPTDLVTRPPAAAVKAPEVSEDDWRWNCLTMGNHLCGPDWVPVDKEFDDLLDEVEQPSRWTDCLTFNDGEADLVVCPDDRPVVAL